MSDDWQIYFGIKQNKYAFDKSYAPLMQRNANSEYFKIFYMYNTKSNQFVCWRASSTKWEHGFW